MCSCGNVFNFGDNIYYLNRCIKLKSCPGDMNPQSDYYIWVVLSETAACAVIEWLIELRLDPQNKSFMRRSSQEHMLWNHRYWPLKLFDVLLICSKLLLVLVASFHRGWPGWVDPDSWLVPSVYPSQYYRYLIQSSYLIHVKVVTAEPECCTLVLLNWKCHVQLLLTDQ